jgi:POT family proton-dependent oligopeptide transporter
MHVDDGNATELGGRLPLPTVEERGGLHGCSRNEIEGRNVAAATPGEITSQVIFQVRLSRSRREGTRMRDARVFGFAGHPSGLTTLFFTEMWERFSFYGLQALLILYLVLPVDEGGLGFSVSRAATIYGNYTMSVYLFSIAGGYVADRWLGAARAVMCGGLIIVMGHVCLASGSVELLFAGLVCVSVGTALLKPNVTALVGRLYDSEDARRDAGYSLYYMGISVGALFAPIVCGYLAQGEGFRRWLATAGWDARASWHWGFAAAGVGMCAGLVVFASSWSRWRSLARVETMRNIAPASTSDSRRFLAIAFFCACAVVFFATAKQAGSSLNLFADRYTRHELFGWNFPSSWFQSMNALWVIVLTPVFSELWLRMGSRQPAGPTKAVAGLVAAAGSLLVMAAAAAAATEGAVSPLWLVAVYLVQTIGELLVSPVGLSNLTRLAPVRLTGLILGAWFVAIAFGAKLASFSAVAMGDGGSEALRSLFTKQAALVLVVGVALALFTMRVRTAMVDARQS